MQACAFCIMQFVTSKCMCIAIYICIYVCVCICVSIYARTHVCVYKYIVCSLMYVHLGQYSQLFDTLSFPPTNSDNPTCTTAICSSTHPRRKQLLWYTNTIHRGTRRGRSLLCHRQECIQQLQRLVLGAERQRGRNLCTSSQRKIP